MFDELLSKKELWILTFLRKNSRLHLTKIGKRTDIPISTVHDKLKKGKYDGVITKFTALVDFSKIGYNARAIITLKVKRDQKSELFEFLSKNENVNCLCRINNGYDFMVEMVFKGIKELEGFLDRIDNKFEIEKKEVYHVIEDVKRESFLSDPNTFKIENKLNDTEKKDGSRCAEIA